MGKTIYLFALGGLVLAFWTGVTWYIAGPPSKMLGIVAWIKRHIAAMSSLEKRCATCTTASNYLTVSIEKGGVSVCEECANEEFARHKQA